MAEAQLTSAAKMLGLVVVSVGLVALVVAQSRDTTTPASAPPPPQVRAVPPQAPAPDPEAPIKLGSVSVPVVRDYFTSSGYRFEDKPLPGNLARAIGTSPSGQTVLEFVGPASLEQATLRYTLRDGNLDGGDVHAIMHLMQYVKAGEAEMSWGIDAARKGEPTTRTIDAVAYAIERGPGDTKEFVMRPAPGFE